MIKIEWFLRLNIDILKYTEIYFKFGVGIHIFAKILENTLEFHFIQKLSQNFF